MLKQRNSENCHSVTQNVGEGMMPKDCNSVIVGCSAGTEGLCGPPFLWISDDWLVGGLFSGLDQRWARSAAINNHLCTDEGVRIAAGRNICGGFSEGFGKFWDRLRWESPGLSNASYPRVFSFDFYLYWSLFSSEYYYSFYQEYIFRGS